MAQETANTEVVLSDPSASSKAAHVRRIDADPSGVTFGRDLRVSSNDGDLNDSDFAQIDRSFGIKLFNPYAIARDAQRDVYVQFLKKHDWSHEFSDEHAKCMRGREQLAELRMLQKELDGDFAIWNQHCNPSCINGKSYA